MRLKTGLVMVLQTILSLLCANRFVFRTKHRAFREPLENPALEIDKDLPSLLIIID